MQLPILSLGVSLLPLALALALAHPAAPASPTPSSLAPLPNNNNNKHITGNFSHSCDQITLMNKYFLAATCSPIIEPGVVPGSGFGFGSGSGSGSEEGEGDGKQHHDVPAPEFNQLDLNMCIGFDQGTGGPESGGGVYGKLIWQALGTFANYCTDCSLTGPGLSELKCSCVPMTGAGATVTVLDLDEGVENRNGTLVCRGGMGSGIGPGPLLPED